MDPLRSSNVPSDFGLGYYVEANGFIKAPCNGFGVSFLVQNGLTYDIAFYFNPRLFEKAIIRNHCINNYWGSEERYTITPYHQLNLRENSNFHLAIFITSSEYVVELNKKYVCQFSFRIPPRKVNFIQFTGDCLLNNINFKNLTMLPQLGGGRMLARCNETLTFQDSKRFSAVPANFGPGYYVEVKGFVLDDCVRFHLDFLLEKNVADISFRLNPLLHQNAIACNDRINNFWGIEHTDTYASLQSIRLLPETEFCIGIVVTNTEYLVEINGKYVCQFVFRLHPAKVKFLDIRGDCEVYDVAFRNLSVFPKLFPK